MNEYAGIFGFFAGLVMGLIIGGASMSSYLLDVVRQRQADEHSTSWKDRS